MLVPYNTRLIRNLRRHLKEIYPNPMDRAIYLQGVRVGLAIGSCNSSFGGYVLDNLKAYVAGISTVSVEQLTHIELEHVERILGHELEAVPPPTPVN